jgi:hypothetical protein
MFSKKDFIFGVLSVLFLFNLIFAASQHIEAQTGERMSSDRKWFPYFDFNPQAFQQAPRGFGPLTRWWLPGNDIKKEELQREIIMFADNGFAGVELQPISVGLKLKPENDASKRVFSWDTPDYYENLGFIMQRAQEAGLIVDMTAGSGWPLGGPFVAAPQSMKTLAVSDAAVTGGVTFSGALPPPHNHDQKAEGFMALLLHKRESYDRWAKVQSVIAARVIKQEGKQTILDPKTPVNLTDRVKNNQLTWKAPAGGEWRIIVSWIIPTGESPSASAAKNGLVVDHLDPDALTEAYDYLLGERTGLPKYYQKPLRAVFNDSYEFHVDRIYSPDFLNIFKAKNGYDIAPFLATVFQKGYDMPPYLAAAFPGAKPPFALNQAENWRLMYDYDAAVGEVLKNNFIGTSNRWTNRRGLLNRTQAYGIPLDMIGAAGAADIPETEQMFGGGSEGYFKLVTSGAHLYNRPVVTQESFVAANRAEMTTPQKIKMWADKSFAAGVNQIIYHGTPYKYNNGEFGPEGWNTFSSPYQPFMTFATGMNESDPFWKDIRTVNEYLSRCQYALRSGKPRADVLIYMPFNDVADIDWVANPQETMNLGSWEGIDAAKTAAPTEEQISRNRISLFYKELWTIVNQLEAQGINWEFVNDDSLSKARLTDGRIDINGNHYQVLIMANAPFVPLATARQLNVLSKQGMKFRSVGKLPEKQPSFLNYEENDRLTKQLIGEAARQKNSRVFTAQEISDGNLITQKIKYALPVSFTRQITREMADGSLLKFFWNRTDEWQTLSLKIDKSFSGSYFLNPENGKIEKINGATAAYRLPPYGTVILHASARKLDSGIISAADALLAEGKAALRIDRWKIGAGDVVLTESPLIDWRADERLKFKSDEGSYTASFNLSDDAGKSPVILDLGKVFFTAEIFVNGQAAGKRIFAPFRFDISKLAKPGANQLEVRVTPTRRNGFVGEALRGNPFYAQFKGKQNELMPAGLIGPVTVLRP